MSTIAELKKKVLRNSNFQDVMRCFLMLADAPEFLQQSSSLDVATREEDNELDKLLFTLDGIAKERFQKSISLPNTLIMKVKTEPLYHGTFFISDMLLPIAFFYFSDLQYGLLGIHDFSKGTEYLRFSVVHFEDIKTKH